MSDSESNPRAMLIVTRVLWAAAVASGLIFGAFATLTIHGDEVHPMTAEQGQALAIVGLIAVGVSVAMAIYCRGQVFKRGWVGHAVTPQAYLVGTLAGLAICEAPVMLTLVFFALARTWVLLIPVGIGLLGLLALWPNGKAMMPRLPEGAGK